ncbi:hypothetical protein [uncultured Clostridium sp.]|uniref:hypothetical protein n=1 Tax=uncultured Clostridium sp. TaxID=59620 RepID=UPI0028EBA870|nr:hypothetical protein [uncultured Clostridium sp.]
MKNSPHTKWNGIHISIGICLLLLFVITITGACSFSTSQTYEVVNQYGDTVKLWGSGVYAHDSYFRAPIFIGSDITMLIIVIPFMIASLIREIKHRTLKTQLSLISYMGVVFYYATSIAFGVTYNQLHLLYISLFGLSLFILIALIKDVNFSELKKQQAWNKPTKGVEIFLICSGIALMVAWLPDVVISLINNHSLSRIEVYTTEITNVLDIGILSPLMFICLYLLRKGNGLGDVIFATMIRLCEIIAVMVMIQSAFQLMTNVHVTAPELIGKAASFILLAAFAFYFDRCIYKNL